MDVAILANNVDNPGYIKEGFNKIICRIPERRELDELIDELENSKNNLK